ncbi:hypothetical protein NUM3379_04760 [Kineococcus sp. NUM-3379]
MVGADGQLAVAAVHEHREAHDPGAAEVGDGVEGGADGAPGVQDVVDEDDHPVVEAAGGQLGGQQRAGGVPAQVVAVHRDVEGAGGDLGAVGVGDAAREALGEGHPAGGDAQQHEVRGALVRLEQLVGDAGQRAVDVGGLQQGPRARRGLGGAGRGGSWGAAGSRRHVRDLLLRLTGRFLKGRRSPVRLHERPRHIVSRSTGHSPQRKRTQQGGPAS